MSTEPLVRQRRRSNDPKDALNEIKDRAIMLDMASEYLCEKPFLKKAGFSIEQNLVLLRNHIEELKGQFVGKPVEEIGLDAHLDRIAHIATLLKKADNGINHKCLEGELSKELSEKIISLSNATKALKKKIEGRSVSYTWIDSFLRLIGHLRFVVTVIVAAYKFTLKVIGLFVLVGLMVFSYLFITMEKEKDLLPEIEQLKTSILSYRTNCTRIGKELTKMNKGIDSFRGKELTRRGQMELVFLNLRAYGLAEEQEKNEVEMNILEETLGGKMEKLENMRKKSFLERLFRR